jgi:hypothetical protein
MNRMSILFKFTINLLQCTSREGVMYESTMKKWYWIFNEGRANFHDDKQSWHPSLITEDLENRIDQHIRTKQLFRSWCNSWDFSSYFLFSDSWNYYGASPLQKNLCKIGAMDAHWRAQEQVYGCCFDVFEALSPRGR